MDGRLFERQKEKQKMTTQDKEAVEAACKHPDDSVITVSGKHKPWEGQCELCGKQVRLVAVPCEEEKPLIGELNGD